MTCVLTIIKDEQDYLEDFIIYHIDKGIDKIFIFEDIDSTSHEDICDKYPKVELRSIAEIVKNAQEVKNTPIFQLRYMHDCLMWIKNNYNYDWCFVIDADEFITTEEPISELLKDFEDYDALTLYWQNYGCSGHITKPIHDRPIWEIFTEPCNFSNYDLRSKSFAKPCFNMNRLKEWHISGNHYSLGNSANTKGEPDKHSLVYDRMYIRHYITKSLEEWMWKLYVRGITSKGHRGIKDFFEMNDNYILTHK